MQVTFENYPLITELLPKIVLDEWKKIQINKIDLAFFQIQ